MSANKKITTALIRVHAVIGDPNAGKGTVIRHLSGCRTRSDRWYLRVAGKNKVFSVRLSSLQEGGQAVSPKEFVGEIKALGNSITDILIPLRTRPVRQFPAWDSYLLALQKAGYQIKSIAFLNPIPIQKTFTGTKVYIAPNGSDFETFPSNCLSDDIRSAWSW